MCYLYFVAVNTNTTASSNFASVMEGTNINFTCTSTGGPVPSILWTLNDQATNFTQTDVVTEPTDSSTIGSVVSTLHIVNAQYPTHFGVYTCTGTNPISSSSDNITLMQG